ncbi:MAG TPA: alpha/beta hydrolase, partial [Candidatus Dormibacteraeota bacterium]|nr:alpha/beta hydrolase [Candidatus Dormibacteraeota bacterium]
AATERALRGAYAPQLRAMAADPARARAGRGLGCCLERPDELDAGILDALLSPIAAREDAARDVERLLVALRNEDLAAATPGLAALRVPTLLVWGTADPFFETSRARRLQRLIPDARLVELDGGRLYIPLERAAELAALLREHWAAVATL